MQFCFMCSLAHKCGFLWSLFPYEPTVMWFSVKIKKAEMWLHRKASFSDIRALVCNFFVLPCIIVFVHPPLEWKLEVLRDLTSSKKRFRMLWACAILSKISSEIYHAFRCVLCSLSCELSLFSHFSICLNLVWKLHFSCLGCSIVSLFYISQNMHLWSIKYVKWVWCS
jgi:hypothetical protein